MKQKLIAIGSDGCRIVSAMLEAGLFTDIPQCCLLKGSYMALR